MYSHLIALFSWTINNWSTVAHSIQSNQLQKNTISFYNFLRQVNKLNVKLHSNPGFFAIFTYKPKQVLKNISSASTDEITDYIICKVKISSICKIRFPSNIFILNCFSLCALRISTKCCVSCCFQESSYCTTKISILHLRKYIL